MQYISKMIYALLALIALTGLSGCAKDISDSTYDEANANQVSQVFKGQIIEIRMVKVHGNSHVGGLAGGAAGAVIGSNVGGGRGALLGVIAGAVAGGVLGDKVDQNVNSQMAQEIFVQLDDGRTVSVVQTGQGFALHQRVMVIMGANSKVIPDNSQ